MLFTHACLRFSFFLIEELIEIDYDENMGTKITRLATHLRAAISSTDPVVVSYAARAIGAHLYYRFMLLMQKLSHHTGHLAKANASSFSLEFVEFEVKRSFEWLQYEPRRFAAVTVLRQLASAVPTLFIVHVSTFFDQVLSAFRFQKSIHVDIENFCFFRSGWHCAILKTMFEKQLRRLLEHVYN